MAARSIKSTIWKKRIEAAYAHAGGVGAYCRDNNLNVSTFQYWREKLVPRKIVSEKSAEVRPSPFVEVCVESPAGQVGSLPDPRWLAAFASELIRGLR
jgi:hypothetical protein